MKIRLAAAGCLLVAALLYAPLGRAQYWRERACSNAFTQGYKAYNPYVGGYGDVSSTVGYNPYTGRSGAARGSSNAGTGPFGQPVTGSSAAKAQSVSVGGQSNAGTADAYRDKVGYNPYTGNEYVSGSAYGARTGQRMLYAGTYNPMTGNATAIRDATSGAGQR